MKRTYLLAGLFVILSGPARSQPAGNTELQSDPVFPTVEKTSEEPANPGTSFSFYSLDGFEGTLYLHTIKRRRLQGKWESWYANEMTCDSGSFFRGYPDGEWRHWNDKGQLLAIRTYHAEKLMRVRSELGRFSARRTYSGLTRLIVQNKFVALRYLQASYSFPGSRHLPAHFSLQTVVEHNISPGASYQPVFDECLHHGLFMNFLPDGRVLDSGYYRDGLREGIWLHRNSADGSVAQGVYVNGRKTGSWKIYEASGRFSTLVAYDEQGRESWRKKIRH